MLSTYTAKLYHYIVVRFPLYWMLPLAINRFLLPYLVIYLLSFNSLFSTWTIVVGSLSCLVFLLTQRITDDVLDEHEDRLLATQGIEKFQKRPLVTGAISALDLIWFRRMLYVVLIAMQFSLMTTQANGQRFITLLLVTTASYIYINHISWRISSSISSSGAIAIACYALGLVFYETNYFAIQNDFSEVLLSPVLIILVSWLPIMTWQGNKILSSLSVKKPEFKTIQRRLTTITILVLITSTTLIILVHKLQLGWVLVPLFILVSFHTYVYVASLKNMTLHPWFHKSASGLALFQHFILPLAILLRLALN